MKTGPGDIRPSLRQRLTGYVPVLALLVIVAAIPYALLDTWANGRIYLFSSEFLDDLPRRFTGAGRLRFILQPLLATVLGVRSGVADARAGNPPFLTGLLLATGRRRELFRSGLATISTLLAMGIILDLVFQFVLYRSVHPGAALVVGPILIGGPYALSRSVAHHVARILPGNKARPL